MNFRFNVVWHASKQKNNSLTFAAPGFFYTLVYDQRGVNYPQRISGFTAPRNEIPTATRMFSGSGNSMVLSIGLHVETGSEKFKMAAFKPDVHVS